jgi:hypothetical protein
MNPKEKAYELVCKFIDEIPANQENDINKFITTDNNAAKQCALIAVDEIIEQNNVWIAQVGKGTNQYWQEVRKEIKQL